MVAARKRPAGAYSGDAAEAADAAQRAKKPAGSWQADLAALPASAPMGQSSAQAVRDRCKKIDRDGASPCKPHPRHAAMAEAVLKELKIEQAGATNNHVPQRVNTPGGFVQNVAHKSWTQIKDAARTAGIESSDKDVWGYVVRFMAKAAQQSISY